MAKAIKKYGMPTLAILGLAALAAGAIAIKKMDLDLSGGFSGKTA